MNFGENQISIGCTINSIAMFEKENFILVLTRFFKKCIIHKNSGVFKYQCPSLFHNIFKRLSKLF